jgi:hypothetical protein
MSTSVEGPPVGFYLPPAALDGDDDEDIITIKPKEKADVPTGPEPLTPPQSRRGVGGGGAKGAGARQRPRFAVAEGMSFFGPSVDDSDEQVGFSLASMFGL